MTIAHTFKRTTSERVAATRTRKGARVWIQALESKGITAERVTVVFEADTIGLVFSPDGKRKVTRAKGGIVDIESKKVLSWLQGAETVSVIIEADSAGNGMAFITRESV